MNNIKAEIVAHSTNQQGDELISVLCTFPRIILAEVNTHRMLSKNTSSSRAIPFNKMVEAIQNNPFIPIAWQIDHKGMQGTEYHTGNDVLLNDNQWLEARDKAIFLAQDLNKAGVTKQLCNRLLEPFMWTTMLITGSRESWDNFFKLRNPSYDLGDGILHKSKKDALKYILDNNLDRFEGIFITDIDWLLANKGQAEIHMMVLSESIYNAVNESTPKQLQAGEWHIPFGDTIHKVDTSVFTNEDVISPMFDLIRVKVSTAMAARTSYTVVGEEKAIDYEAMINLHDRLINQTPPHSSPFEHCCRAMSDEEYFTAVKTVQGLNREKAIVTRDMGWCNNIKGFIQYRYFIDNNISL